MGAKTSSGYGRMLLTKPPVDPDQQKAGRLIAEIESIRAVDVAGSINNYYQLWRDSELSPLQKRRVAEAIVNKIKAAGREKRSKDKMWYQELIHFLNQ